MLTATYKFEGITAEVEILNPGSEWCDVIALDGTKPFKIIPSSKGGPMVYVSSTLVRTNTLKSWKGEPDEYEPEDCNCVLPSHSCSVCRVVQRRKYGSVIPIR